MPIPDADIVERLRFDQTCDLENLCWKAADEIDKLRAENEALRKLAKEAADEIVGYVDAIYPANDRSLYPDQMRRYKRDMDIVVRIEAALRDEGE